MLHTYWCLMFLFPTSMSSLNNKDSTRHICCKCFTKSVFTLSKLLKLVLKLFLIFIQSKRDFFQALLIEYHQLEDCAPRCPVAMGASICPQASRSPESLGPSQPVGSVCCFFLIDFLYILSGMSQKWCSSLLRAPPWVTPDISLLCDGACWLWSLS